MNERSQPPPKPSGRKDLDEAALPRAEHATGDGNHTMHEDPLIELARLVQGERKDTQAQHGKSGPQEALETGLQGEGETGPQYGAGNVALPDRPAGPAFTHPPDMPNAQSPGPQPPGPSEPSVLRPSFARPPRDDATGHFDGPPPPLATHAPGTPAKAPAQTMPDVPPATPAHTPPVAPPGLVRPHLSPVPQDTAPHEITHDFELPQARHMRGFDQWAGGDTPSQPPSSRTPSASQLQPEEAAPPDMAAPHPGPPAVPDAPPVQDQPPVQGRAPVSDRFDESRMRDVGTRIVAGLEDELRSRYGNGTADHALHGATDDGPAIHAAETTDMSDTGMSDNHRAEMASPAQAAPTGEMPPRLGEPVIPPPPPAATTIGEKLRDWRIGSMTVIGIPVLVLAAVGYSVLRAPPGRNDVAPVPIIEPQPGPVKEYQDEARAPDFVESSTVFDNEATLRSQDEAAQLSGADPSAQIRALDEAPGTGSVSGTPPGGEAARSVVIDTLGNGTAQTAAPTPAPRQDAASGAEPTTPGGTDDGIDTATIPTAGTQSNSGTTSEAAPAGQAATDLVASVIAAANGPPATIGNVSASQAEIQSTPSADGTASANAISAAQENTTGSTQPQVEFINDSIIGIVRLPLPRPAAPGNGVDANAGNLTGNATSATSGGGAPVYLQLTARRSVAQANTAFREIQDRFPSLLGDFEPLIESVDIEGRGTFHRVLLAFPDAPAARNLCTDLQASGGDCFVRPAQN